MSSVDNIDDRDEVASFDWQSYGRLLWRRKYILLALFVAALAVGGIYVWTAKPVYEAKMLLLFEDKNSQPQILSSDQASSLSGVGGADISTQINTQIQVLSSRPLVTKALSTLKKQYAELRDKDFEDVSGKLDIAQVTRTQIVSVSYKDTNPALVRAMLAELAKAYINYGLEVQQAKVDKAILFIDEQLPAVRTSVRQASDKLQDFRQRSSILDPGEQGTDLAKTLNDINQKLEEAKVESSAAKEQYVALQGRLGVSPSQGLASATLSKDLTYQETLKQLQDAEKELALEQTRFREGYPTIQNLKIKRDRLQQILTSQARQVLRDRGVPAIVSGGTSLQDSAISNGSDQALRGEERQAQGVSDRLGDLQVTLVGKLLEAENTFQTQQARAVGLSDAKERLIGQFKLMPSLAAKYEALERDAEISANSLKNLLTRLEELHIQSAQQLSNWRVIDPAVLPEKPVWPRPILTLSISGLLGGLLGFVAVVLLEALDDRIKSIDRAKETLNLPLLGAIPFGESADGSPSQLISSMSASNSLSRQAALEAFRTLLTNLQFLNSDYKLKVLLATSSLAGEGKSTILTNLAVVASNLNRRVLLVDADLRRPTVSKKLELLNGTAGLSSVLAGATPWRDAIQPLGDGLDVITSGPIPPDPVVLLDSNRLAELIEKWRAEYDLVLIDGPPLIGLADSPLLARQVDGLILVVGLDIARRTSTKSALERLRSVGVAPLGMVINGVRKESDGQSYYNQSYYHYNTDSTSNGNGTGLSSRAKGKLGDLFSRKSSK